MSISYSNIYLRFHQQRHSPTSVELSMGAVGVIIAILPILIAETKDKPLPQVAMIEFNVYPSEVYMTKRTFPTITVVITLLVRDLPVSVFIPLPESLPFSLFVF